MAVALQPDGRIVAAGFAANGGVGGNCGEHDFALARYEADGSLDGTFGAGGTLITTVTSLCDEARAVAVQPDGKIVAAGFARTSIDGPEASALVRYLADGTLDGTFGVGGIVKTQIAFGSHANALLLAPDGGMSALGGALAANADGTHYTFAVARYESDGRLDRVFGGGGTTTTQFPDFADVFGGAIQPNGRLVVGGGAWYFALARFRGVACGPGESDVCRAADGPCDVAESCDGMSEDCPPDAFQPDGGACNDGSSCTAGSVCQNGFCGTPIADGTSCDDGDPCVVGFQFCTSAHCVGGAPLQCPDCKGCSASGCVPAPRTGCHTPVVPGKSPLLLKRGPTTDKNAASWQWAKGAATTVAELGDPTASDAYALCVYDVSAPTPQLELAARAQPGCNGNGCWTPTSSGFKYKSKLPLQGITGIAIKAGTDQRARIGVKGKGATLAVPPLPPALPLLVQLHGPSSCWEADYSAAGVIGSDGTKFRARDVP